jgi:hypothetical protein
VNHSVSSEPSDHLIHEVYARFGLAYYQSDCLYREVCFVFALSGLPDRDLVTRPRIDERLAQAYSLSLGEVAAKLEVVLPTELFSELQKAVEARNFLAHHFWFERAHLMFGVDNIQRLIAELDSYGEQFSRLDLLVVEWNKPKVRKFGLTEEMIDDCQKRIASGEPDEPLPDRQTVRELEKKLNKPQRLIRVWKIRVENDPGSSLIFEMADGSLWQLSDVGLGWTRFTEVGPDWSEHPAISHHLPADILPRPRAIAPWDYEFTLAKGAVLWVKPGRRKQSFAWGVRVPKMNAQRSASGIGE